MAIAGWLETLDLPAGSHVGHYMRNSNAHIEAFTGMSLDLDRCVRPYAVDSIQC